MPLQTRSCPYRYLCESVSHKNCRLLAVCCLLNISISLVSPRLPAMGFAFAFSSRPPGRVPSKTTQGQFGALGSKLYQMLAKGHHDLKLSKEHMARITLWLDCNSVFFGAYKNVEAQLSGEYVKPELD